MYIDETLIKQAEEKLAFRGLRRVVKGIGDFVGSTGRIGSKVVPPPAPAVTIPASTAASKVKDVLKQVVRPTPAPKAPPLPAPAPAATKLQSAGRGAGKAVNYIANVPKGERFLDRPIANTRRLLTLDGVPGMRRLNQLAGVTAAGATAKGLYDTNEDINEHITETAHQLSLGLNGKQNKNYVTDFNLIRDKLHSAKWKLLQDQTVGQLARPFTGETRTDVEKAQNKLIAGLAYDSYRRNLANDVEAGNAANIVSYRTPVAATLHQVPTLTSWMLGAPDPTALRNRLFTYKQEAGTLDPRAHASTPLVKDVTTAGEFAWNSIDAGKQEDLKRKALARIPGATAYYDMTSEERQALQDNAILAGQVGLAVAPHLVRN